MACALFVSPGRVAHAQSGSISGTVTVDRPYRGTAFGGPGSYRGPRTAGARDVREASPIAVWLETDGGPGGRPDVPPPSGPHPVLNQRDTAFAPGLLPIRAGQTVRVLNSDPLYHNVFSLSAVRRFNIGRRRTGESVPVRFDRPGVVEVFCDIHSHMNATILVLPERVVAFAQVEAGRPFQLRGLRSGTYLLHVFAAGSERFARSIEVRAGRDTDVGTINLNAK